MKECFREICDDQDLYNNLEFKTKLLRIYIRYIVIIFGLKNGFKILNFSLFFLKRNNFTYTYYLLKINIFRLNYIFELSMNNYVNAIKIKKLWSEYVASNSVSATNKANANFYLNVVSENYEIINRTINHKRGKFYIYGPGCKHDPNPIYHEFTLVHLKPSPKIYSSFKSEILILNSYYFTNFIKGNIEAIKSLTDRYSKIYLTCMTSNLPEGFKRINLNNNGYISSEMALQRTLLFLSESYKKPECVIEGFNFYLKKDAYSNKNYHKLTRQNNGKIIEQELCLALAEHDFLFNFIFTKKIMNKIKLKDSDEFKGIINLTNEEYMQKLFKIRDFTSLRNIR